ncbi:methyltransferase domain-containing protein [Treponema sp.]|uniref:cytidylyltransferase domain-containing protein n=1 Tax=Treponema sp. TaxID=166 RepID=UPI0025E3633C|nr:methyltransferase domain-containing protein [Treponema sp.]MCR5219151.1 methyltransferase domain-containing protein [Treponema sp.]
MKTVVIAQCRLSSTRLPGKALLPLAGKPVLEWVLAAMKKVAADDYYLALDYDSESALRPVAEKCGWNVCAGPLEDVLARYLKAIDESKADLVIRATCDNPFLFYEAADSLLKEFLRREQTKPSDYMTYTGLPHGSGVEIFKASSLRLAAEGNDSPYDHEHVGPSLYNHKDRFICEFLKAPKRWFYPDLRTTIDTPFDYFKAVNLADEVILKRKTKDAFTTEEILDGLSAESVKNPVLFVPCVQKGRGTGHLRRCLELALKTRGRVYIPSDSSLEETSLLLSEYKDRGLKDIQITDSLADMENYALVAADPFISSPDELYKYSAATKVLSIDDGSNRTVNADYLLKIIPSLENKKSVNLSEPAFIPMPENKKKENKARKDVKKVIVSVGGEDPLNLAEKAAVFMADSGYKVTLVKANARKEKLHDVELITKIDNLKEHLADYDLCITHFGFTAFEALGAGIKTILLSSSDLHEKLAIKYGFPCVRKGQLNKDNLLKAVEESFSASPSIDFSSQKDLPSFIKEVAAGKKYLCPVCRNKDSFNDEVIARTADRTFRRCKCCGMQYISYTRQNVQTEYNHDYFFDDYKKQYGKTYLDDFDSIKVQCKRRMSVIDSIYRRHRALSQPVILDIGCAMGPFLQAASEVQWMSYGTDICKEAVEYIQQELNFPASCSAFPDFDSIQEFGIDQFDAVTMWYVIEHFQNLDSVLKAVSSLVKKGGIFAFSTPSASGVSARYNRDSFYENSPADHYSLWELDKAKGILSRYGFKVVQIVSTGIHPERHPSVIKHKWTENDIQFNMLKTVMKLRKSGDTFEVYCRKI